jgi:hypothetical protein
VIWKVSEHSWKLELSEKTMKQLKETGSTATETTDEEGTTLSVDPKLQPDLYNEAKKEAYTRAKYAWNRLHKKSKRHQIELWDPIPLETVPVNALPLPAIGQSGLAGRMAARMEERWKCDGSL